MSLLPEKKKIENEYQRIVSLIIIILGVICIVWFVFHLIVVAMEGGEFNFFSVPSMVRILLGLILIATGYVMYKFIDWGYDRPRPIE